MRVDRPVHRCPAPAADAEPEAQTDHQGPEPRLEQEGAHPPGRHRRIASMVRSALPATRLESAPSRSSSLAVNSSVSRRSASSRLRSRSVNSFALEVKCVQLSFQPPPVPGRRIQDRQVVLALARHFEARLPQGGDDIGPVPHRAVLDTLEQVVPDQVAGSYQIHMRATEYWSPRPGVPGTS